MPWGTRSPPLAIATASLPILKRGRSVLTVALPSEIEVMRSQFGLVVTPVDQVDGFVLTKGKKQTLQLAVVHEADVPPAIAPLDANAQREWAQARALARSHEGETSR